MTNDGSTSGSPTITEILVTVRPIKVIGMMLVSFALLLMVLAVAATAWIEANSVREGLFERCHYRRYEENMVDCVKIPNRAEWLMACQGLFLLAMAFTLIGVVGVSVGLRRDNSQRKFRLYMFGVAIWIAAVVVQLVALIIYPVKFLDELPNRSAAQWHFGWSYGLSWAAAVCIAVGAILVFIDRGAEEIEEREVIIEKESFEEEEQPL